jgi:hypothetical protein
VPSTALVTREGKSLVAAVGEDKRLKFTPVDVAGTDGKVIRIANGIGEGVRVALNVPNTISDGAKVNPAPAAAVPGASVASTPANPPATPQAKPAAPTSPGTAAQKR